MDKHGTMIKHLKKVHLVNWETVCRSKNSGGLGLRRSNRNNLALISKLGWKVSTETSPLWVQTLKAKYLKNCSLKECTSHKSASHFWKGIMKIKGFIADNTKWIIGNGRNISFWHDWWVSNEPLESHNLRELTEYDHNLKISGVLLTDGRWNLDYLNYMLPTNIVQAIIAIPIPRIMPFEDTPVWGLNKSGKFSTKSAYHRLCRDNTVVGNWKWIWKQDLPQKLKGFLWTLKHGKLLTNYMRVQRNFTADASCHRCDGTKEDLVHLFWDCHKAKQVWKCFLSEEEVAQRLNMNFFDWVEFNLRWRDRVTRWSIHWHCIFTTILWHIWKDRNLDSFEGTPKPAHVTAKLALDYALEIHVAFTPGKYSITHKDTKLISWDFPPVGFTKLNTDGAAKGNPGNAGFGGIFRDDQGKWIAGYYGKLGTSTSLVAELWSIRSGIKVAKEQGYSKLIVESDSKMTIDMVNNECEAPPHVWALMADCKAYSQGIQISFQYTYREGNFCADFLANKGVNTDSHFIFCRHPPAGLGPLINADIAQVTWERSK